MMKKRYYNNDYYENNVPVRSRDESYDNPNRVYRDRAVRRGRKYSSSKDYDEEYYNDDRESGVAYVNNFRSFRNKSRPIRNDNNCDEDEDGYYDQDYPDTSYDEDENETVKPNTNSQLLIVVQIVSCAIIILGVLAVKSFSPQYYDTFKNWYELEINKSIIAGTAVIEGELIPSESETPVTTQAPSTISSQSASAKPASTKTQYVLSLSKPIKSDVVITDEFGNVRDDGSTHKGLDLAANEGTFIYSALCGVVEVTGENDSYGKYIIIKHDNKVKTLYAHCNSINVTIGQGVSIDSVIASVGSTGDSTGPHLHFELIINEEYHNPMTFMNEAYV